MFNKGSLFSFLAILLWSTLEITGKAIGSAVSPLYITIWRFVIGGVVVFLCGIIMKELQWKRYSLKDIWCMSYPGILNIALSMLFLQLGIYYGKASLTAILISTNPLFVAFFAYWLLKEHLPRKQLIGILIGLAGILVIIGGEKEIWNTGGNILIGTIFGLLASITFAFYTVASKSAVRAYGSYLFNSVSFLAGTIVLILGAFILGEPVSVPKTTESAWLLLYLGVAVTGLAYVFFFEGLRRLPAANVAKFFFLKPVIASVLACLFLSETLSTLQIIGIGFILIGMGYEELSFKRA